VPFSPILRRTEQIAPAARMSSLGRKPPLCYTSRTAPSPACPAGATVWLAKRLPKLVHPDNHFRGRRLPAAFGSGEPATTEVTAGFAGAWLAEKTASPARQAGEGSAKQMCSKARPFTPDYDLWPIRG